MKTRIVSKRPGKTNEDQVDIPATGNWNRVLATPITRSERWAETTIASYSGGPLDAPGTHAFVRQLSMFLLCFHPRQRLGSFFGLQSLHRATFYADSAARSMSGGGLRWKLLEQLSSAWIRERMTGAGAESVPRYKSPTFRRLGRSAGALGLTCGGAWTPPPSSCSVVY